MNNIWKVLFCVVAVIVDVGFTAPSSIYRSTASEGGSFQFTCRMGSNTRWERPLGNVISNSPVLSLENIQMKDAGLYICVSDDNVNGMSVVRTMNAELVVEQDPQSNNIRYQPQVNPKPVPSSDRKMELYETQLLDTYCRASYGYWNDYSARWVRPDGSVAGNGERLFIHSVMKKDEGEYICQIQDLRTKAIVSNNKMILTVKEPKLRVESLPSEKIEVNGMIHRRCIGFLFNQSVERYFYAWLDNKGQVVAMGDTLRMPIRDSSVFGKYQCQYRATNSGITYSIESNVA